MKYWKLFKWTRKLIVNKKKFSSNKEFFSVFINCYIDINEIKKKYYYKRKENCAQTQRNQIQQYILTNTIYFCVDVLNVLASLVRNIKTIKIVYKTNRKLLFLELTLQAIFALNLNENYNKSHLSKKLISCRIKFCKNIKK